MKNKKILVVGKNKQNVKHLMQDVKQLGFSLVKTKPEIVICLGGDGTYLYAERLYPGIPKLLIRDQSICYKCPHDDGCPLILEKLKKGQYTIEKHLKLEATLGKKKITCANDFMIRNQSVTQALRFSVFVNKKKLGSYIGDGVVIATPFGSTAYFYSITKRLFKTGIGLALNNTTTDIRFKILKETSRVSIVIDREKAEFAADNDKKIISLKQGDRITIKKASKPAQFIKVKTNLVEKLWKGRRKSLG